MADDRMPAGYWKSGISYVRKGEFVVRPSYMRFDDHTPPRVEFFSNTITESKK